MAENVEEINWIVIFAPLEADQRTLLDATGRHTADTKLHLDGALGPELEAGPDLVILTEEALGQETIDQLRGWAASQPNWSAPPILILINDPAQPPKSLSHLLGDDGYLRLSIVLLPRPVAPEFLHNAIRTSLKSRQRQKLVSRQIEVLEQNRQHIEMLAHEIQHRSKNSLVRLQSILRQTWRNASSPEEFIERFEERLMALARGQDLLTHQNWRSIKLHELISTEIAAIAEPGEHRLDAQGPSLSLTSNAGLALHLVLHELTTNASKYGALSVKGGKVQVRWQTRHDDDEDYLHIYWKELGGPPVDQPKKSGFGSRLINLAVERDLNGKADVAFEADGFRCELAIPARHIQMQG